MPADEKTAAYLRPFDLVGKTLTFVPVANEAYLATRSPAVQDANRGTLVSLHGANSVPYRLPFDFPMFGTSLRDVHLSRFNGIHAAPAAAPPHLQYDALEVITQRTALIAPMLTPSAFQSFEPDIYVRETETFATITWVAIPYEVQAKLFRDGKVVFSYLRVDSDRSCAVVVTSGAEQWRDSLASLGSAADPAGDLPAAIPDRVKSMLDLTNLRVDRVGSTGLLRFQFEFADAPDPVAAASVGVLRYTVTLTRSGRTHQIYLAIMRDGSIQVTNFERILNGFRGSYASAAARIDGRVLSLEITDDLLPFVPAEVALETSCGWIGDAASAPVVFDAPISPLTRDFAELSSAGVPLSIVLEVFTRPAVSLLDVWARLQAAYGWRDDEVDAVAIYQNFSTDTPFFGAAYALGGNAGADGIGIWGSTYLRFPNLIDMTHPDDYEPTLLHEFGHRWLYHARYRDPVTGNIEDDLNPDGVHPAQWVDTRAAFSFRRPYDCSAMGGGVFTDKGGRSFDIAVPSPYSWSWFDLYLMGLAAPEEVGSITWFANTNPPLGSAYHPWSVASVQATQREVHLSEVIVAEGARYPAYPATQRRFTTLFVLLVDPSKSVAAVDIATVAQARDALVRNFRAGTGQRGEVVPMSVPERVPRRRAVRH